MPPSPTAPLAHPPRPQLRALTGVRFFAAAHVVVFHCVDWPSWPSAIARGLAGTGYVAVSLFFVLSGFILTYTYFGGGARTPPLRELYAGRFARIYPVYALGLLLAAPFFAAHYVRERRFGELVLAGSLVVTLLQAWVPRFALAWNAPSWSLSCEAFFYAVFPFLAPRLLRCPRGAAVSAAVIAWLVTMAAGALYLARAPDGLASPTYASEGTWLDVLRYDPAFRALDFVVGIVLGRLFLEAPTRARVAPHASIVATVAAVAIVATLAASERLPYVLLHAGLLTPLFAALVFALACDRGALASALGRRTIAHLGEASYALYVLHVPAFILWRKAVGAVAGPEAIARSASIGAYLVAVVIGSLACFRWIEVPARGRIRAALARR